MMDEKLLEYLKIQKKSGYTKDQLREYLIKQGYSPIILEEALGAAFTSGVSMVLILGILVSVVIVSSAGIFLLTGDSGVDNQIGPGTPTSERIPEESIQVSESQESEALITTGEWMLGCKEKLYNSNLVDKEDPLSVQLSDSKNIGGGLEGHIFINSINDINVETLSSSFSINIYADESLANQNLQLIENGVADVGLELTTCSSSSVTGKCYEGSDGIGEHGYVYLSQLESLLIQYDEIVTTENKKSFPNERLDDLMSVIKSCGSKKFVPSCAQLISNNLPKAGESEQGDFIVKERSGNEFRIVSGTFEDEIFGIEDTVEIRILTLPTELSRKFNSERQNDFINREIGEYEDKKITHSCTINGRDAVCIFDKYPEIGYIDGIRTTILIKTDRYIFSFEIADEYSFPCFAARGEPSDLCSQQEAEEVRGIAQVIDSITIDYYANKLNDILSQIDSCGI